MLTPEMLPVKEQNLVTHVYPDGWSDEEVDSHRYDECPCSPTMVQCMECPYHWIVTHQRSLRGT